MSKYISNKVRKIIADHLGVDESKIKDNANFIDDLGADSLDTVELVMAFEEEFGAEIEDSEAEKILTVGDVIRFIENKLAKEDKPETNNKKIKLDTGTDLPPNFILTDEFKAIFNIMENKKLNMFITGKAGSGKSTLLEYFRQNTKKNHVILAPTGISAIKARGKTIHSFFHYPPRIVEKQDIKTLRDQKLIKKLDTILIDESSMIRADIFDAIDHSLKKNRKNTEIFGGVQIILIGDLFQLPPVVSGDSKEIMEELYPDGPYFFNSKIFKKSGIKTYEMKKIFRQKDEVFINFLNKIRICEVQDKDLNLINKRVQNQNEKVPEGVIILSPKNVKVNEINTDNLNKIDSKLYEYSANIRGDFKDHPVDKSLKLKVGAQVMIVKNDLNNPRRWVNGTLAIVEKLSKDQIFVRIGSQTFEIKKEAWNRYGYKLSGNGINPNVIATFVQYPLKLAWAATIHKCQGQTFEKVAIDLDTGAFAHGQTYVALSRATSMEGLFLKKKIYYNDLIFDKRVYDFLGTKIAGRYLKEIKKYEKKSVKKIKKEEPIIEEESLMEQYSNSDKTWSSDEDLKLLNLYNKNVPLMALQKIFKRRPLEIRRRMKIILKKIS